MTTTQPTGSPTDVGQELNRPRSAKLRKFWKVIGVVGLGLIVVIGYFLFMTPRHGNLISEGSGGLCFPSYSTAGTQVGQTVLDNSDSSKPVTVTSVNLVEATDMELVSAWVLPIEDWQRVVLGTPFDSTAPEFHTALPVNAAGLSVVPARGRRGLIVELRSPTSGGNAERLQVEYKSTRSKYFSDGGFSLQLAPLGQACE